MKEKRKYPIRESRFKELVEAFIKNERKREKIRVKSE
jgi:hypothetical protein